mmetsp:Transcript_143082/g.457191  ORF Transcript_143082/g.457191 Transcript_143082/m.457191 type:complete len:243 (-) Transcript_143082:1688-2416(-)
MGPCRHQGPEPRFDGAGRPTHQGRPPHPRLEQHGGPGRIPGQDMPHLLDFRRLLLVSLAYDGWIHSGAGLPGNAGIHQGYRLQHWLLGCRSRPRLQPPRSLYPKQKRQVSHIVSVDGIGWRCPGRGGGCHERDIPDGCVCGLECCQRLQHARGPHMADRLGQLLVRQEGPDSDQPEDGCCSEGVHLKDSQQPCWCRRGVRLHGPSHLGEDADLGSGGHDRLPHGHDELRRGGRNESDWWHGH